MNRARDLLLTAVAPLMFGSTYIVTTEMLPPDRPLLASALRALPAGLLLTMMSRRLPKGEWWWRSAVIGFLNIMVFFALLFIATYRLPGGIVAVVMAVGPLAVAGLSMLMLKDSVRTATWLWGVVGVGGVAMVVLHSTAALDGLGLAAGLGAMLSTSLAMVLTKKWGRPEEGGSLALAGWQLTIGGLLLVPLMLAVEGVPPALTPLHLVGFGYLTLLNTTLGYYLWFRGLALLPLVPMSFLALLSPLAAVTLGWIVLGESLTLWQLAGMAVALIALLASQTAGRAVPVVTRVAPAPVR